MEQNLTAPTERIEKIVAELRKHTAQEAYTLKIEPDRTPTIFDSKFGGQPYWDLSKPYPTDPTGEKLLLLAQINFDTAEVDAPLPQTGMLQFFIAKDDVFGLDFDAPDRQETFRVVYHERIDRSVTEEQIRALGIEQETELTPVFREVVVSMHRETAYINPECCHFDEIMVKVIEQVCGQTPDEADWDDALTDAENEYLYDTLDSGGHWMLGYPYFTQSDPRECTEEYERYDTLLFQMDSDMGDDGEDYVLWGDSGVGNFFIAREDLEKQDFSKVLYNWDCC